MAAKDRITAERLRELMHYDPKTGEFFWKSCPHPNWNKASLRAGTITSLGYRAISIDNRVYRGARLAWLYMTGDWPRALVDHVDGNRSNDRFNNLRQATFSQNAANAKRHTNNTSGWKGVTRGKRRGTWIATIKVRGRVQNLGVFYCPAAAHLAYVLAATRGFGEFARAG